ncbi:hypothetical protein F5X68DRAFT_237530 [Plectosphaerella plurivora]|uniref:Uncharacterized protein n=1 Tax=Plectosphaerella plurivora TaxID=936078 RepID=A0A9P8V1C8_9PEZI|nr:hypothetical protein F5X68DRAFT_237530 [Plectosphaerella plurivora]
MKPLTCLTPAFYFNATVKTILPLGDLNTGGQLILGRGISGKLTSERGYGVQLSANLEYVTDYPTIDPSGAISRIDIRGLVVPDDQSTPLQIQVTGIQESSAEVFGVVSSQVNTGQRIPYGSTNRGKSLHPELHDVSDHPILVAHVEFRGGSAKYSKLQNGLFVGSSTVSSGPGDGEFTFGLKIMEVLSTKSNVVIGQEL